MGLSFQGFCQDLSSLSVKGVRKYFTFGDTPPESLKTAQLPCLFLTGISGTAGPLGFQGAVYGLTITATLWLVIAPVGQGTASSAFKQAVSLLDEWKLAFERWSSGLGYIVRYSSEEAILSTGEQEYRGIRIQLTAGE